MIRLICGGDVADFQSLCKTRIRRMHIKKNGCKEAPNVTLAHLPQIDHLLNYFEPI